MSDEGTGMCSRMERPLYEVDSDGYTHYVITEEHSIGDVLVHLVKQVGS